MSIKKYFNLMLKDVFLCKNIILLMIYCTLVLCFFKNDLFLSSTSQILVFLFMIEMLSLNITYSYSDAKSKGTELLTTTSYTRKNVVASRYMLFVIIEIIQLLVSYLIVASTVGFSEVWKINPETTFGLTIFITNIAISIFIPLGFKFSALTTSVISAFIMSALETIAILVNTNIFALNINSTILFYLSIILSIIFIILSFAVSCKIFCNKDL